jgi:phosphohistidine phosphatase
MKTLLLIRHAKSSWANPQQNDFERSLNERGKADAQMMAKRLKDKKIKIDVFVSSPARRAITTCEYFVKQYQQEKDAVILKSELYLAAPPVFEIVIEQLDDEFEHAALFSHNNGITEFANQLTDTRVDDMPTCAVFAIKIHTKSWKQFKQAKKEFWFFDYPKNQA